MRERGHPGRVQDLVGVRVADAGQHLLIGEHALDLAAAAADPGGEGRRVDGERVRARAGPPRAPAAGRVTR